MRILVLTNLFPPAVEGGYERECAGVVEHLRSRHEVTVLTSSRDATQIPPEPGVVRVLPRLDSGKHGTFMAPWVSLRTSALVAEQIEAANPDLVYVWNGSNLTAAATIAAVRSARPVAMRICEYWLHRLVEEDVFGRYLGPDLHGSDAIWGRWAKLVNRSHRLQLPGTYRYPVAISWVSDFLRRATEVTAPCEVAHSDVTYPALPQGERLATIPRAPSEGVSIAVIGRLVPQKGVEVAIRALATLRDRHGIAARLQVAGPGDPAYIARLEGESASLGLSAQVEFLGPLESEEVAEVLSRAHIALVPSTWEEPAGLAVLEAAAARVPVVASRSGGIPELLIDGQQVLLFDIGDFEGCAEQLASVIGDPKRAERMTGSAFDRSRELSFDRYLAQTDRFLENAITALRP